MSVSDACDTHREEERDSQRLERYVGGKERLIFNGRLLQGVYVDEYELGEQMRLKISLFSGKRKEI